MKKELTLPIILTLPKIGTTEHGYLSLVEKNSLLPFTPKRIYWIYETPKKTQRGGHYHHNLQQIIICVKGKLKITLETNKGFKKQFELEEPNKALYIPSSAEVASSNIKISGLVYKDRAIPILCF